MSSIGLSNTFKRQRQSQFNLKPKVKNRNARSVLELSQDQDSMYSDLLVANAQQKIDSNSFTAEKQIKFLQQASTWLDKVGNDASQVEEHGPGIAEISKIVEEPILSTLEKEKVPPVRFQLHKNICLTASKLMPHVPAWPDRSVEKLQLSAYLGNGQHCSEEHTAAISGLASTLLGNNKSTKMRQILVDATHQAEAISKRFNEDRAAIADHEKQIRRQENESELIKKLSELTQQNETTLMKQLMAQFDSMKRDIRHLKQRGAREGQAMESPRNDVTIDEAGVTDWFSKFSALSSTMAAHEVTVGALDNETVDNKVKMYNNAVSIKKVATKLKRLLAKKQSKEEKIEAL